jgi:CBS domain-containing protein
MKVSEVMSRTPAFCVPGTNLGTAAEILWNRNCGILPVVNAEGHVVSVITDRDICIALGTRNRLAGELAVGDVAAQAAVCCNADEDIRSALARMGGAKLRRLPVVDSTGKLLGLLSMDDVVDRTPFKAAAKGDELTAEEVVATLKRLYAPLLPAAINKAAAA